MLTIRKKSKRSKAQQTDEQNEQATCSKEIAGDVKRLRGCQPLPFVCFKF